MARWDACHSTAVQKDGDTSSKDHVDRDNDEDGESDEMKSNARKADKSWSRFGVQSESDAIRGDGSDVGEARNKDRRNACDCFHLIQPIE